MKISGLFIAALLTPLVIACSAGDAQPTQTDFPSELPTASLTPPPTLTATPTGLYEADIATGEIRKASTPQETLWRAMFNEDRSKVLYSSFQWVSVDQGFPERGPPFAVKITDLASGTTRVVWESDAAFVSDAVWAPDETAVAFSMDPNKLAIVDLTTGELKMVTEGDPDERLQPRAWLSDGRIVYTIGPLYGDLRLMTVRTDGSDPIFIDDVEQVHVFGELPSSPSTP